MNRKLVKTSIAVCALSALILAPACAKDSRGQRNERERRPAPQQEMRRDMRGEKNLLMGTVKSVDTSKSNIVITDADGNDKTVHVNPMTRIAKMLPPPEQPANENPNPPAQAEHKRPEKIPGFEELSLGDIKKGMWLTAESFNTNTEVVEAEHIKIKAE